MEKEQLMKLSNEPLEITSPGQIMEFGKTLQRFIVENGLAVKIQNKTYSEVDGWKFAGANFGLSAITSTPVRKHEPGQYIRIAYTSYTKQGKHGAYQAEQPVFVGFLEDERQYLAAIKGKNITREEVKPYFAYECECVIIRIGTGEKVGSGTGFCSNLEAAKFGFDEYAVNSMAQTRSIGKGYRNLIGYVMKAAKVESTPAEEMEEMRRAQNENSKTEQKQQGKPTKMRMNDTQFKKTLLKVNKGEVKDIEVIEAAFDLNEEQRSAIESVFKSKSK